MKKLLFLLLFIPFIAFGQEGNYYKVINNPKSNGIDLKFKIPVGFEIIPPISDDTFLFLTKDKRYEKNKMQIVMTSHLIPKDDRIYDYNDEEIKWTIQGKRLFNIIPKRDYKYFSVDNYPGLILDTYYESNKIYLTQILILINKKIIIINFGTMNKNRSDTFKSDLKKFAKSIIILNQPESIIMYNKN